MMTVTRSTRPRLAPLLAALALMVAALTVASAARADPRAALGSVRTLLDSAADAALSDAELPLTAGPRASPRLSAPTETGLLAR
jgi:hypothetical protein